MTTGTYLFAGGGTGGHLFPGIAVAEELLARDESAQIVFVGSEREVERRILETSGFEHRPLASPPSTLLRRNPFRFAWHYGKAARLARRTLDEVRPRVVVGLGGFASVPVVRAAARARVPIVLLEQNVVPGRATRWLAKRASVVCTSFVETAKHLSQRPEIVVTGNPVRRQIADLTHEAASSPRTLLVLGGSQGATAVNDAVLSAVEVIRDTLADWRIVHQTGEADADRVRITYDRLGVDASVEPFFDDLVPWYRAASLCVTRAGATSLAELACAGVPVVTIPYPNSIRDHQRRNAEFYARGAGQPLVEQSRDPATTAAELAGTLESLFTATDESLAERGRAMRSLARPDAAAAVADVIVRTKLLGER